MSSPAASPSSPAPVVPHWLRFVLKADRSGSAWYVGTGFFFAPALAVLSPWPALTVLAWVFIGVAGLWLGLLGIAMAAGLAMVLRSGQEIPEDYWRTIIDYPREDVGSAGGKSGRPSERGIADGRLVTRVVGQHISWTDHRRAP